MGTLSEPDPPTISTRSRIFGRSRASRIKWLTRRLGSAVKVIALANDPKGGYVELDDPDFDDLGIGSTGWKPVRAVHFEVEIECCLQRVQCRHRGKHHVRFGGSGKAKTPSSMVAAAISWRSWKRGWYTGDSRTRWYFSRETQEWEGRLARDVVRRQE